jgi:hypothetical protein
MRLQILAVLALVAAPVAAQSEGRRPDPLVPEGDNMATPPTWHVRFDDGHDHGQAPATVGADSTADVYFVNMTPGWHVTTGPAAILYHPASTAAGVFRAETMIHLFEPGDRNEAFGLIIGGRDLDGECGSYDYFVIRKTGEFLVKRRIGTATSVLVPWTAHPAILAYGADAEGAVANTLAIEAGTDEVRFLVNDAEVARLPRAEVHAEGVVGLRVNHGLNLHVETFSVSTE